MPELEDLLVDKVELDRSLLAELLSSFVGIDAVTKDIVPQPGWGRLGPDGKILVYLLARKAMMAIGSVELDSEGAAPKEIEASTGVKGGTLRPKLVRMKHQGLLAQDRDGGYLVPTHAVLRAKEEIEGGLGENGQAASGRAAKRSRRNRRKRQ